VPANLAVTVGPDGLTLGTVAGRWRIDQRRNGQSFSVDALRTAWAAPVPGIHP
jgi:hypothetical protein